MASKSPSENMDIDIGDVAKSKEENDSASSARSDESSDGSESDQVKENKIKELQEQVQSNPYHYDSQVELISLLRKAGELEKLRTARENMSKTFPLSSDLWIDWLTDEIKLLTAKEERQKLEELFQKAVKDYLSVPVWLEYAQFSIGGMDNEKSIENIRSVFENALISAGLHVTEGCMLWDAYREFEIAIYNTIKDKNNEEAEQQKSRILALFRRQLSVPLFDMEKTYSEFEEWSKNSVDKTVQNIYQKALKKLKAVLKFEENLLAADAPRLLEYLTYIDYEMKEGEPTRIQCLYERALVDNCLRPTVWLKYTQYLDRKLKIDDVSLPVHERAIRNCPWSGDIWVAYITALERYKQGKEKIKEVVDAAFNSGVSSADDLRNLWLAYINYLRRSIDWKSGSEDELEQLRKVFQKAIDTLQEGFGAKGDPDCVILRYWAKVEAKFCDNMTEARELWNQIFASGHTNFAHMWMEYANLERAFGDSKHYRKILIRGLMSSRDWPETLGDALLSFEREEGTLESLDIAEEKYETQMAQVQEKRRKEEQRDERQHHEMHNQGSSHSKKRKFGSGVEVDEEGFKIPQSKQGNLAHAPGPPHKKSKASPPGKSNPREEGSAAQRKKQKDVKDNPNAEVPVVSPLAIVHDPEKDMFTAFLSNLDYDVEEETIRGIFAPFGTIESLRLVRDYKGRSKGYCYVQYSTREAAQEALKLDRHPINGRPVFVSPCKVKQKGVETTEPKLKYHTGLEKNKLFVRGLPFHKTQEDVKKLFDEFGQINDVRLVTYRNGHSKGLAYVDFQDEKSATAAIMKMDGKELGEGAKEPMSVAFSNPPPRKPKFGQGADNTFQKALGGTTRETAQHGSRGRSQASQMAFVPRSLNKAPVPPQQNGASASTTAKKMSNDDFRNMLLKK